MVIEDQDLASAAVSLAAKQNTSNYVLKYFSPYKNGNLAESKSIIGIGGREESEVLRKYVKASRYCDEAYALNSIDRAVWVAQLIYEYSIFISKKDSTRKQCLRVR